MPQDGNAQIVIYAVLALVLVAAIVVGRRLRLKLGSFSAGVDAPAEQQVNVANDVQFENVEAGNVTGSSSSAKEVNVLNRAVIRGGKLGDITGSVSGSDDAGESK